MARAGRPDAPAARSARPSGAVARVLALQASAGNRAVAQLLRQPSTPLTPAAARAAAADVMARYDEDSVRMLKAFGRRAPDATFTEADAQALALLEQALGLTPTGKAGVAFLNALLAQLGPTHAARSGMIHLVVDQANVDVSAVVSVVHEAGLRVASELRTFKGGVGQIRLGNGAFADAATMTAEIRKQLAVRPATAAAGAVPAAILNKAGAQRDAIAFNRTKLNDPRSIRLVQGATSSAVTGAWDAGTVRHVAAKQTAAGRTGDGKLDQATLEAITTDLIGAGSHDAAIHLLIDYFDLDRTHAFDVTYNPTQPAGRPRASGQTLGLGDAVGSVVEIYPYFFTRPFAGKVHTLAHELGHVQQRLQGIASDEVREFLSECIELESKNMPEESIESDADIDLMIQGNLPANAGFIQNAQAMLHRWGRMTLAEKTTHHQRYKDIRTIIVNRINTQGTATQKTKLQPFIQRLRNANAGVP